MRLKISSLLALLAAFAISAPAQAAVDTYGTPATGRVFLLHGLRGHRQDFANDPAYRPVLDGLLAQGWQVVTVDEPYDQDPDQAASLQAEFTADPTGKTYRLLWADQIHRLISDADYLYGPAPKTLFGGISWGGFHAIDAACTDSRIDGYFAHAPVIDPTYLAEFNGFPLQDLKLTAHACPQALAQRPGYISWGGADLRVGVEPVRDLIAQLGGMGAPLASVEFPALDHSTTPETISRMLEWTQTQVAAPPAVPPVASPPADPSVPATAAPSPPTRAHSVRRSHCARRNGCVTAVRRGKVFHVYRRRSPHPRWVYIRKVR